MNRVYRDIFIGLGITLGLVIFAELGLRLFWRVMWPQDIGPRGTWTEEGGWRLLPGRYTAENSPLAHPVVFNSIGYRGEEWSAEKPKNVFRIICAGDSVVMGMGTATSEGDFPRQLEFLLNKQSKGKSLRYQVYNAGLGANNSFQTLHRIQNELFAYQPDMLIVSVGLNDLEGTNPGLPKAYQRGGAVKQIAQHSYLIRAWAGLMFKVIIPKIKMTEKELEVKKKMFSEFIPESYRENLSEMAKIAREKKVKIAFVTLPTLISTPGAEKHPDRIRVPYYARDRTLYKMMVKRYNDSIRETGKKENVAVADLADFFENMKGGAEYFWDNAHINDEGYRIYAKKLLAELTKKGML